MTNVISIKQYLQSTIAMMESLEPSSDFAMRKQIVRMVGDQYEALIELGASELRSLEQLHSQPASSSH